MELEGHRNARPLRLKSNKNVGVFHRISNREGDDNLVPRRIHSGEDLGAVYEEHDALQVGPGVWPLQLATPDARRPDVLKAPSGTEVPRAPVVPRRRDAGVAAAEPPEGDVIGRSLGRNVTKSDATVASSRMSLIRDEWMVFDCIPFGGRRCRQ